MKSVASTYFALIIGAFLIYGMFYLSHSPVAAQFTTSFEKSLSCSADSDCTSQQISCDICSCGTGINKNSSIELWCLNKGASCASSCDLTVPKCVNKMCTLVSPVNDRLACSSDSDCTMQGTCGCTCPTPVNFLNVVYLRCAVPDCGDMYCPNTVPKCISNVCVLEEEVS